MSKKNTAAWSAITRLKTDEVVFGKGYIAAGNGASTVYAAMDTGIEDTVVVSRSLANNMFAYMPEPTIEVFNHTVDFRQGGRHTSLPRIIRDAEQVKPFALLDSKYKINGTLNADILADSLNFIDSTKKGSPMLGCVCLRGDKLLSTNRYVAYYSDSGVDVGDTDIIIQGDLIKSMIPTFSTKDIDLYYNGNIFEMRNQGVVFMSTVNGSSYLKLSKVIEQAKSELINDDSVNITGNALKALKTCVDNIMRVAGGEHDYISLRFMDKYLVVNYFDDKSEIAFEETVSLDSGKEFTIQFHAPYLSKLVGICDNLYIADYPVKKAYATGSDGRQMVAMVRVV